jgi:hypothetical protein
MSNDISTQTRAPKAPVQAGGALAALVPENIEQAFRLAQALASSGDMVPRHFQGRPEATMAAIVRGMEIGLAPMQALSSIAVINGRASLWGDAMPALMQRAGHHVDVEVIGQGDKAYAEATLTRGDSGKQIVRRFSMDDAKRAGLLAKQGPWQQYPTRMLMMRARSWAIRDGAADALMGLQVADEVQDYGPDAARDITPQERSQRRRGAVTFTPVAAMETVDPVVDEIHEHQTIEEKAPTADLFSPTPEQIAAAEAEALAEIDAADRRAAE